MTTLTILAAISAGFVIVFTARAAVRGPHPRRAIAEAWVNILIGFTINYIANLLILNGLLGVSITHGENWQIGWIYTAISMLRQYAIRRWFQERVERFIDKVTGEKA